MRTYQMNTYAVRLMILTALLLSSVAVTLPVRALPADSMWIEPASIDFWSNTTFIGHKFNVTVWLNMSTPANSWQFYLIYNNATLSALRCDYTGNGKSLWSEAYPVDTVLPEFGSHNSTYRYVLHGEVLKSTANKTGAGSLAWIEFEMIRAPGQGETLSSMLSLNVAGLFSSYVMDSYFNETPLSYGAATYTYTYAQPPQPESRPWLEVLPETVTMTKPGEFTLDIYVRNLDAGWRLIGAQFAMLYNSSLINAVNITVGTFMSNSSWAIHGTYPTSGLEDGRVVYGELILPNGTTGQWDLPEFPSGGGLLATITFETLAHEAAMFNLSAAPLLGECFVNADLNYMPFETAKDCLYTYDPLPTPLIAVTPGMFTASSVGQEFDIDVTIAGIDAQWMLTFGEFKLTWDERFLALINGTEGAFMKSFGTTTLMHEEGPNYVKGNITLVPTSVYPSGSGTLVTFRFNVTQVPGRCPLTLTETKLLDSAMNAIPHRVQSGYYRLHEVLIHPIVWGTTTYNVVTVSNASVTPVPMMFDQPQMMLAFNVTDYNGTVGFVDVSIPKDLLYADLVAWDLQVDGIPVIPTVTENATHATLSFTLNLSPKTVQIFGTSVVPEITLGAVLLAFLAAAAIGLIAARKIRLRKRETLVRLKQ